MRVLIIGGTSGLGLALAERLRDRGEQVYITGRKPPAVNGLEYLPLELAGTDAPTRIDALMAALPPLDMWIYAAGFYEDKPLQALDGAAIEKMIDVGIRGLTYGVQSLLHNHPGVKSLVVVTSTAQWNAKPNEIIYGPAKAYAGHFAKALALGGKIPKVLVAGPSGMNTPFWEGFDRKDVAEMLDPAWVAEQILHLEAASYSYLAAKILRQPPRIEEVERLPNT